MHSFKRGLALAVAAAALAAPAVADAAITPNPYSTIAGTGGMTLQSALGTASCAISGIVANATSTATGATGTISGYTASGCTGIVTGAAFSTPMPFTVSNGAVTLNFSVLKRTILGAGCLYVATLTGTMTNGSNTFTVRGTKFVTVRLNNVPCTASLPTQVTITLPGAAISW